jgi:hypothetical protein
MDNFDHDEDIEEEEKNLINNMPFTERYDRPSSIA